MGMKVPVGINLASLSSGLPPFPLLGLLIPGEVDQGLCANLPVGVHPLPTCRLFTGVITALLEVTSSFDAANEFPKAS